MSKTTDNVPFNSYSTSCLFLLPVVCPHTHFSLSTSLLLWTKWKKQTVPLGWSELKNPALCLSPLPFSLAPLMNRERAEHVFFLFYQILTFSSMGRFLTLPLPFPFFAPALFSSRSGFCNWTSYIWSHIDTIERLVHGKAEMDTSEREKGHPRRRKRVGRVPLKETTNDFFLFDSPFSFDTDVSYQIFFGFLQKVVCPGVTFFFSCNHAKREKGYVYTPMVICLFLLPTPSLSPRSKLTFCQKRDRTSLPNNEKTKSRRSPIETTHM